MLIILEQVGVLMLFCAIGFILAKKNIIKAKSETNKAAWASEGIYDVDDFNAIFLTERTAVNSRASNKLIAVYSES